MLFSDVATAAIAAAEWGRPSGVSVTVGITDNAVHTVVRFQRGYLVPQLLNLICLHQCPGLLTLCVDRRGNIAGLPVNLRGQVRSRKPVLAAALSICRCPII